jgi:hypothetical protein
LKGLDLFRRDAEEAGAVGGGGAAHEELEAAGKVKLVAEAELVGNLFDRGGFGQESARGVSSVFPAITVNPCHRGNHTS